MLSFTDGMGWNAVTKAEVSLQLIEISLNVWSYLVGAVRSRTYFISCILRSCREIIHDRWIDRSTSERRKYQRAHQALILLHRLENVSRCMFVCNVRSPICKRDRFSYESLVLCCLLAIWLCIE